MKKTIIFLAITMLGSLSFAANKQNTLGNEGDFIVISDVEASSQTIFLSYTGKRFNHCGIALRANSFSGVGGDELNAVLSIKTDIMGNGAETGEVRDGKLVSALDPDDTSYGAFFIIESRSGENLKDVIGRLDKHTQTDVIVEILECK